MQNPAKHLIIYHQDDIAGKTAIRSGEVKVGEQIRVMARDEGLKSLRNFREDGVKYVLLGIPESIGPMANHGSPGAENGWQAFLGAFLNMQSNRFLDASEILCLGQVATEDLQTKALDLEKGDTQYFQKLRDYCGQIDNRVAPVIEAVASAGLVPVIIGGGHNNAYPVLKGIVQGLRLPSGIGCINCDPHADFRATEGRHSGNGFSYAYQEGFLKYYFIVGLQESYNGEALLQALDREKPAVEYTFAGAGFQKSIDAAIGFYAGKDVPVGLELDLDSIKDMPASAFTPVGIGIEAARTYVQEVSATLDISYLHLAEGAPQNKIEEKIVGKSLAFLVSDFIKCKNKKDGRMKPGKQGSERKPF